MPSIDLLFLPVALVKTTLPHSRVCGRYVRTNGRQVLTLLREDGGPLPFGVYPRIILAHLTALALRSGNHELWLGSSMSTFLGRLGLHGRGPRGQASRARQQCRWLGKVLFAIGTPELGTQVVGERIIDRVEESPERGIRVLLSDPFFRLTRSAVPLDPRLLRIAGRSPFRFDLYAWLTYRAATLSKPTRIPWFSLAAQFGADYSRVRDFRRRLRWALDALRQSWPEIEATPTPRGLRLEPFPPSVKAWATQRMYAADIKSAARGAGTTGALDETVALSSEYRAVRAGDLRAPQATAIHSTL